MKAGVVEDEKKKEKYYELPTDDPEMKQVFKKMC